MENIKYVEIDRKSVDTAGKACLCFTTASRNLITRVPRLHFHDAELGLLYDRR